MSDIDERHDTIWHMPRAVIFTTIVRAGSITAAARQLGLSKSVVSAHLKELEEFCETKLLERTTRTQRMTQAGQIMLRETESIWRVWSRCIKSVRSANAEPTGTLRITTPSYLFDAFVRTAMSRYLERFPDVRVSIDISDERRSVFDGNYDVALRVAPRITEDRVDHSRLGSDEDIVVAAPSVAAQYRSVTHPSALRDARWILHQHLSNVRKFSGPSLVELKLAPAVRVSDGPAMLSLALDEVGLAIIPSLLAKDALEAGRLVRVLPRWNCGSVHIYAVQPKLDIEAAKTIRFVEFLREILRSPSSE